MSKKNEPQDEVVETNVPSTPESLTNPEQVKSEDEGYWKNYQDFLVNLA